MHTYSLSTPFPQRKNIAGSKAKAAAKSLKKGVSKRKTRVHTKVRTLARTNARTNDDDAAFLSVSQSINQSTRHGCRPLTHSSIPPKHEHQVHFYRPKTVKLARNPKYARKSVPHLTKMDKYRLIRYPLTTG
jgi:hypothetical protein